MNNKNLKTLYNSVYSQGSSEFFTFDGVEEMFGIIDALRNEWAGRRVLEIGCGEGRLASILAGMGAQVLGVDYSQEAIKIAKSHYHLENLEFQCAGLEAVEGEFDIICMQGVLEHVDDPLATLKRMAAKLKKPGWIVSSSPNFLNPRGYVWMALLKLFDVPMSLSDVHYFCPFDYEEFAKELGAGMSYFSTDQEWGHGNRLLIDFNKRLRNATRDKGMPANVDAFLDWLAKTNDYTNYTAFSGANIVYTLSFGF